MTSDVNIIMTLIYTSPNSGTPINSVASRVRICVSGTYFYFHTQIDKDNESEPTQIWKCIRIITYILRNYQQKFQPISAQSWSQILSFAKTVVSQSKNSNSDTLTAGMVREKSEKYDAVIGQILNHAPQSELIGNLYIILRMYPLSCGQENQVDRSSAYSLWRL